MIVLSAVYQDTDRFDRRFPPESLRSARNATLSPTVRLMSAGTTVTVATGADEAVTCTRCMSLRPPLVAVIVAKPCSRPVMRTYAPPLEPALGSRTDKGVVLPAVTCTPDVITGSRFGRNGSSIRTT